MRDHMSISLCFIKIKNLKVSIKGVGWKCDYDNTVRIFWKHWQKKYHDKELRIL